MNDDYIIDQSDLPQEDVKVKNENLFLKETTGHTEIPLIESVSIILVIVCATLSIMSLSKLREKSPPPAISEKQKPEEIKDTEEP